MSKRERFVRKRIKGPQFPTAKSALQDITRKSDLTRPMVVETDHNETHWRFLFSKDGKAGSVVDRP